MLGLALVPATLGQFQPVQVRSDQRSEVIAIAERIDEGIAAVNGIDGWSRILALSADDDPVRRAPTLFVPSDGALRLLPAATMEALVDPSRPEPRRTFLERSASDERVTPEQIAGRRTLIATLDGRPLVIDATGAEIHVGSAEALEIRILPDGRSLFILDNPVDVGSVDPD